MGLASDLSLTNSPARAAWGINSYLTEVGKRLAHSLSHPDEQTDSQDPINDKDWFADYMIQ